MSSIRTKNTGISTSRKGDSSCINLIPGRERALGGNNGLDERSVTGGLAWISRRSSHLSTCVPGAASYGKGLLDVVVIYRNDCRNCMMHDPSRKKRERGKENGITLIVAVGVALRLPSRLR